MKDQIQSNSNPTQSQEDQYLTGADYQGEGDFYRAKNMYRENEAEREDTRHGYEPGRAFGAEPKISTSPETRYNMIAEAAYIRAKNHNFAGPAVNYWMEAEAQINDMLNGTGGAGDLPTSAQNQVEMRNEK